MSRPTRCKPGWILARHRPPDLNLADVMMPRLDGFGLLHQVRADNRLATVPVVLLTARAGQETAIEGLLAGADDYVVKPFSARELVARIAAVSRTRNNDGARIGPQGCQMILPGQGIRGDRLRSWASVSVRVGWAEVHDFRMRRHYLVASDHPDPVAVADRVGGLQVQVSSSAALSVLARNPDATRETLAQSRHWESLVRMWTLRGTLHLVSAGDVHRYAAALGDSIAGRETRLWPRHGVPATAEDRINAAVIAALGDGSLDRRALARRVGDHLGAPFGELLAHPWGIGIKPAVARGLVRLDGSGADTFLSLPSPTQRDLLGTVDAPSAQAWLARTYLTANLVGNAASFAAWTGLSRQVARQALSSVTDETVAVEGQTYAAMGWPPDVESADAIALLPAFDPYVLAVADKDGFCPPPRRDEIWRRGGWLSATVVRRGLPVGVWKATGSPRNRVMVDLFGDVATVPKRRLGQEIDRLESYLAGGGSDPD